MIEIVKYKKIHESIVERIQEKFPKIVFSTDIEKGITRPSFFIDLDNIKSGDFMNEARDTDITVRLYYFTSQKDNNKIEILEMQDDLTGLFLDNNLIRVDNDMYFEIEELDLSIVDKVLHCYFDIRISENYNRVDDGEVMEELEYKLKE